MNSSLCSSSCLVWVRVHAREPSRMLAEGSQTPPGNVPGGTPGAHPRDRPEAPGRDPEKEHLEELSKSQRAVGVSPLSGRVGSTAHTAHPPSNSPLSSPKGDRLRNNSSSRCLMRASVIILQPYTADPTRPDPTGPDPLIVTLTLCPATTLLAECGHLACGFSQPCGPCPRGRVARRPRFSLSY